MQTDYEKNKDKVIQVLLATVTTVVIDVPEAMKIKA